VGLRRAGQAEAVCEATGGLERCGSLGNGGKECFGFRGMRVRGARRAAGGVIFFGYENRA